MSSQRVPSEPVQVTPVDHHTVVLPMDNAYAESATRPAEAGRAGFISSAGEASLTERLTEAFKAQPLADGEEHPADDIISAFLSSEAGKLYPCELEAIVLQGEDADLVAATLQCTARFEPPWSDERKTNLVRNALRNNDVCVRDAAVRAAESWLCPEIVTALERHQDSEPWLQEYISEVIAE